MKIITHTFKIILVLTVVCCSRVKSKGQDIADNTEKGIKNKSKEIADKVFPVFDAYKADTKYNKERFADFIQIELTNDIKNIYCFDDAIGIDADYQFAFNCNTKTVERIIERHKLSVDTNTNYSFLEMGQDFIWWNNTKIKKLKLYSWKNNTYNKYFCYDKIEHKAYWFEFDT